MFLIFRRCQAQNFLNFLRLKSKPILVNAFWAFKFQMLLNILGNPSFWYKMPSFLPCFAIETSTKLESLICQAKATFFFLKIRLSEPREFLSFFLIFANSSAILQCHIFFWRASFECTTTDFFFFYKKV